MIVAIEGTWNVVIKTPMGDQKGGLVLKQEGDALTGEMTSSYGAVPVEDGKVEGDELSWKTNVTNPMPITLSFTGKIDGGSISGKVKMGTFGVSTFSGDPA
jgi:hypothetical protein